MAREVVNILSRDKEREQAELQRLSESSSKDLAAIEMTMSSLKEQAVAKRQEVRSEHYLVSQGFLEINIVQSWMQKSRVG